MTRKAFPVCFSNDTHAAPGSSAVAGDRSDIYGEDSQPEEDLPALPRRRRHISKPKEEVVSDHEECQDNSVNCFEADKDVPELLAVSVEQARKTWSLVEATVDSGSAVMGFQHLVFWTGRR